jgi:acyl carrier protein phosphodiesterase
LDNQLAQPEKLIKDLVDLARNHPLKGDHLATAKRLMRALKQCGYTNKEIERLTHRTWSESTIKLYTRSTTGIQPQLKTHHLKLFDEIIQNNMSMDDIEKSLNLLSELKKEGLAFGDVLEILGYFHEKTTMVPYLTNFLAGLKQDGITVEKFSAIAEYKEDLDERGYDLDFMERLYEIDKKYGDKHKLLDAVLLLDGLSTIKSEIGKTERIRNELGDDIVILKNELADLIKEKEKLRTEIAVADELSSLGFTVMMLRELKELASRYGYDTASLTNAINKYGDFAQIESDISILRSKKTELKDSIKMLERRYDYVENISKMCKFLLDKFKFNLHVLGLVHQIAARYGEPAEFFRALSEFSSLREIGQKITELESKKLRLESSIQELGAKKSELEERIGTLGQTVISTVEHISTGVGNVFTDTADRIGSRLEQTLTEIKKSYDEYSILRARISNLHERLKVAKIVKSIFNNDLEVIETAPMTYPTLFVQGALNFCNAKRVNSRIYIGQPLIAKYGLYPGASMELIDLLEMAKVASKALVK